LYNLGSVDDHDKVMVGIVHHSGFLANPFGSLQYAGLEPARLLTPSAMMHRNRSCILRMVWIEHKLVDDVAKFRRELVKEVCPWH
jgi:hypothetical protein